MTNRKRHFREHHRRGKSIESAQGKFYAKPCEHGLKGTIPKMPYAQTVTKTSQKVTFWCF
jgi:hypothetical protein